MVYKTFYKKYDNVNNNFDLENTGIYFVPTENSTYNIYKKSLSNTHPSVTQNTSIDLNDGWINNPRGDDSYVSITMPFDLKIYDRIYYKDSSKIWLSSNGRFIINDGSSIPNRLTAYTETVSAFLTDTQLCFFWDDLNPSQVSSPNGIFYKIFSDKISFLIKNVPEYRNTGQNNAIINLYKNGYIEIIYGGCTSRDCILGLSNGGFNGDSIQNNQVYNTGTDEQIVDYDSFTYFDDANESKIVTVSDINGSNKFFIDGDVTPNLSMSNGDIVRFDLSDSTNSGHDFRFFTSLDQNDSVYSDNVIIVGVPGADDSFVQIEISSETPDTLYYGCLNHSGMGDTAILSKISLYNLVLDSSSYDSNLISYHDSYIADLSDVISELNLKDKIDDIFDLYTNDTAFVSETDSNKKQLLKKIIIDIFEQRSEKKITLNSDAFKSFLPSRITESLDDRDIILVQPGETLNTVNNPVYCDLDIGDIVTIIYNEKTYTIEKNYGTPSTYTLKIDGSEIDQDGNNVDGQSFYYSEQNITFYYNSLTVNPGVEADICFLGDTPVNTDQGEILIKDITIKNTINNEKIIAVTKNFNATNYLILISKNALSVNSPCRDTYISAAHEILIYNKFVKAWKLVNNKTIKVIKMKKKHFIYNILLEKHSIMIVNNMKVETLHPSNRFALKYFKKKL